MDIASIFQTGSSSTRVDITFVAEGYSSVERDKFFADATNFTNYIFSINNTDLNAPFSNYKQYFNIQALFVPSNQSLWNSTPGYANTYFNSKSYLADGRLIYGDDVAVHRTLNAALPGDARDITVVIVNSQQYGGSGGPVIWVTSGNLSSAEVLLHELGHTVANLGDEYIDHAVGKTMGHAPGAYPNLTTSPSSPPWKAWLGYEDSLGKVGVYEGGYYGASDVWRATKDSKMLSLGKAFNAPQKEAFALAFYGMIGDYLSLDTSIPGFCFANVPDTSNLGYTWSLDNAVVANSGSYYLDIYASGQYSPGATVSLSTIDATGLIRTNLSATRQTESASLQGSIVEIAGTVSEISQGGSVFCFDDRDNTITVRDSVISAYFDGGAGFDTIVLDMGRASASLEKLASDTWLLLSSAAVPLMAFRNVEFVQFSDYTEILAPTRSGTAAQDIFQNGPGSELIDGGAGTDFLVYSAQHASFTIEARGIGFRITDLASGSVDMACNVERLVFNDINVALGITGAGGQVSSLYQVAFNRTPNSAELGYWISIMDQGMSLRDVSLSFTASAEFQAVHGSSASNAQIVEGLYRNIPLPNANADGVAYWLGMLDSGRESVAGVLALLVDNAENQDALATLIGNSFAYVPYG
ncbi:M64 family metallopeptidase [Massilia varians]|uniref:M64 family metallopeptidase n=1 Tax=Massilia varians TaxID=457921 RepID=UPI0024903730|nr:M64 family metallopeptidase [Massilia varians]